MDLVWIVIILLDTFFPKAVIFLLFNVNFNFLFEIVFILIHLDKSIGDTSDVISDSSGVGTANSDTNTSIVLPGTSVVCIENYSSTQPGYLRISQGDLIEGNPFLRLSFCPLLN